jgi:hypothetical protein
MAGNTNFYTHKNFAISNIPSGLSSTATTVTVTTNTYSRFAAGPATIVAASATPDGSNSEIVLIPTLPTTDTFTIQRGYEGTSSLTFAAGAVIFQGPTASIVKSIEDGVNNLETLNYHINNSFNNLTATASLVSTDAGRLVSASNSSAISVIVPPHSQVPFAIGTQILVTQSGSGAVTITNNGGAASFQWYSPTLSGAGSTASATLKGIHAGATLIKIAQDTWKILGNLT